MSTRAVRRPRSSATSIRKLLRGEGRLRRRHPAAKRAPRRLRAQPLRARAHQFDRRCARPSAHPGVAAVYTCDEHRRSRPRDAAAHPASLDEGCRAPSARWRAATSTMSGRPSRWSSRSTATPPRTPRRWSRSTTSRSTSRSTSRRRCATARRWSTRTHPNNVAAHFVQVSGNPDDAFARGRARHQDPRPGRSLDGGADGMPRGRGDASTGHGRAHRVGRHPGADLGARRPRLDLQARRGQGARHRARMSAAASARRCCCSIPTSCWCRWRRCSSAGRSSTSRTGARTSSARRRSARRSTTSSSTRRRPAR